MSQLLLSSEYGVWDHDKTMKPISNQIKKPNYNEPNIENRKQEKKLNLKKGQKNAS